MSEVRVLDPDARRLLERAVEASHPPFEALNPA